MSFVYEFPPELLFLICAHIYTSGLPPSPQYSPLDPVHITSTGVPTSQPTSYPAATWSEPTARSTLASLSLVNRAWHNAASPWLWRKVEVRLPRSWIALLQEVAGDFELDDPLDAVRRIDSTLQEAAEAAVQAREGRFDEVAAKQMKDAILESIASGPDMSIPLELLSPPASREPSRPRRLRQNSKSPARWTLVRSISNALQRLLSHEESGIYVPNFQDTRPGRFIYHLDFNHFRTIGMRRSVVEGVNSRFVTGERLEALLRETPNLRAFGATEYMDGALTLPVLKELLLRGTAAYGRSQPARGRTLVDDADGANEPDAAEAARRQDCHELQAIDFTGCVSAVFVTALAELVREHLPSDDGGQTVLAGLQRLSFRGAKSITSPTLHTFVLRCPRLTHLDLSGTRVEPSLLEGLAASNTVRLHSLSLSRCVRLTGESIHDFLMHAPPARTIRELNLYGDGTYPCQLSRDELQAVVSSAPCFTSGLMVYLDLSSALIDQGILASMCAQPSLRSLGLAHIPQLPLDSVATLLSTKASHVEVLALLGSCSELGYGEQTVTMRHASVALHTKLITPLCMPPFTLTGPKRAPPTRLRVIELASPMLTALGRGAGAWRVVRSKGGRGWYVDTASGWTTEVGSSSGGCMSRELPEGHPWRVALEQLSNANGNVSSGVGWHARKMEVLYGHGMLGREDGLYGAVSFAYQG